jgi:hypothetical protein
VHQPKVICEGEVACDFVIASHGSRECAPDDSEAIQCPEESLDCFVASAPRNDGVDGVVRITKPIYNEAADFPQDNVKETHWLPT